MRNVSLRAMTSILFLWIFSSSYAQKNDIQSGEDYCKENMGITNFRILGVSNSQYARCVEVVNYAEKDRKMVMVKIEGTEFVDDGVGYDLVANDGILTSKELYDYKGTDVFIPVRQYVLSKENPVIHSAGFLHGNKLFNGEAGKISIACDVYWQSCSAWPPVYQSICRQLTWPTNGGFVISNCRVTWTWD